MSRPLISIVMPSFNSTATLTRVLESIRRQTLPQELIEILLIDGGSTDDTRSIAAHYGAIVLDNPARLPEPAKRIGLAAARGRYAMWEDTDEELCRPDQLAKRLTFLQAHPHVRCMVCDDQQPGTDCGIAALYLCKCGDPFTQFVYRRKGGVIATFRQSIPVYDEAGCVLRLAPNAPTPIGDGGATLFDLDWVKATFPEEWNTQSFVCSVCNRICRQTGCCGCIPGDNIIHHARAQLRTYLSKLRFRVINNLFHPEESGYAARTSGYKAKEQCLSTRKYWFIVYALTILGPLWDSLHLTLKHRSASMLFHALYVYYVCVEIAVCLFRKIFHLKLRNQDYGAGRKKEKV